MFHQVLLALAVFGQVEPAPAVPNPAIPVPLNPNRLVRVHARFAGEVMAIGTHNPAASGEKNEAAKPRPLQAGDMVKEDQVLAIIWSKEVGEKKGELVDALSQLNLDRLAVDRLREQNKKGLVPERSLREAERKLEGDQILVAKLERTLLVWRLNEEDLEAVRAEAERIHAGQSPDKTLAKTLSEVAIRAPFSGVILEMNITKGDIVSTDLDLFKIYDAEDYANHQKSNPAQSRGPHQIEGMTGQESHPSAITRDLPSPWKTAELPVTNYPAYYNRNNSGESDEFVTQV